ncbi:MAG TPA: RluA family pseudouridine synthase [Limnochordia bacterium]|nr:RluA family pseudouridine synthase [Limnochordia bacterium]
MVDSPRVLTTKVLEYEDGLMIRDILCGRLGVNRGLLRRMKKGGGVFLNGKRDYLTRRVQAGDEIQVVFFDEKTEMEPEALPLEIVFEDEYLLVVNKPPGMAAHPTGSYQHGTLANALAYYWEKIGLESKVRLVHRLDKDTSGLILVAKEPYTLHHLVLQLKSRELVREYLAVVHGQLAEAAGVIEVPIGRVEDHGVKRTVDPGGKAAKTVYQVVELGAEATLVRARLESGRTHQIRVHFAHLGHPIVGDPLYSQGVRELPGQALHAWRLEFRHPRTNQRHALTCPLPREMLAVWNRFREGEKAADADYREDGSTRC